MESCAVHMRPMAVRALLALAAMACPELHHEAVTSSVSGVNMCLEGGDGRIEVAMSGAVQSTLPVLEGRVVGASTQALDGNGTTLRFTGLPPGEYALFVSLAYLDFDSSRPQSGAPSQQLLFTARVTIPAWPAPPISDCDCRGRGTWVLPDTPARGALARGWLVQDDSVDAARQLAGGQLRCSTPGVASALRLCVVGDSQGRHLAAALRTLRAGEPPDVASTSLTDREVRVGHGVRYWETIFGTCQDRADRPSDAEAGCWQDARATCDVVLLNFGQWPASGDTGQLPPLPGSGPPWSVPRYEAAVAELLADARAALGSGASRLLWVTTHPHGFTPRVAAGRDWRSGAVLREYARASIRAAERLGVSWADVHSMADVLRDLSYDGAHYKAPVESEIARALQHCATNTPRM